MKRFLFILAAFVLCGTASAQTVKPLAYDMTNGIVFAATNVTWTNSFGFSTNTVAAQVRSNLMLSAAWLTNTNANTFRTSVGLGDTNNVAFNSVTINDVSFSNNEIAWKPDGMFIDFDTGAIGIGSRNNSDHSILTFDQTNEARFSYPINFATNAISNAASITRINLGIGWSALTNTNAANFQSALFSTNTSPTNTTNVAVWVTLKVGTNTYRVPCYQ